jgi:hypothetical protein
MEDQAPENVDLNSLADIGRKLRELEGKTDRASLDLVLDLEDRLLTLDSCMGPARQAMARRHRPEEGEPVASPDTPKG